MITFIASSDKTGSPSLCCLCFVLYDALCQPYWLDSTVRKNCNLFMNGKLEGLGCGSYHETTFKFTIVKNLMGLEFIMAVTANIVCWM